MTRHHRCQITVEAVVIFSLLLLVSVVLLISFLGRATELSQERERLAAQQLADRCASAITSVYASGENSTLAFYFPSTVAGRPYILAFRSGYVIVHWDEFLVSSPVSVPLNTSITLPATHAVPSNRTIVFSGGMITLA